MSNAEKMVSVPREWLQGLILAGAGETVCLHDLEIASQALSEQHHSETIGRLMRDKNERIVIVPIGDPHITDGMLVYTHSDAGEVERMRAELAESENLRDQAIVESVNNLDLATNLDKENERLRAKLAEQDSLLRTAFKDLPYGNSYLMIERALSSSAEPSAPVERDERAEFESWMLNTAKIALGSSDPYPAGLERDYWRVWQARAALERKP